MEPDISDFDPADVVRPDSDVLSLPKLVVFVAVVTDMRSPFRLWQLQVSSLRGAPWTHGGIQEYPKSW